VPQGARGWACGAVGGSPAGSTCAAGRLCSRLTTEGCEISRAAAGSAASRSAACCARGVRGGEGLAELCGARRVGARAGSCRNAVVLSCERYGAADRCSPSTARLRRVGRGLTALVPRAAPRAALECRQERGTRLCAPAEGVRVGCCWVCISS